MDLEDLKNETLTKMKVCKREEEVDNVLFETQQKLMDNDITGEERLQFWKEIYDRLGEREISSLEEETKNSIDPILELSRDRIEEIIEKENKER